MGRGCGKVSAHARVLALTVVAAAALSAANFYTATKLPFPTTGINNLGQVVGVHPYTSGCSDQPYGFLYSGLNVSTLPLSPTAINDKGEIVGYIPFDITPTTCGSLAAIYSGGVLTTFGSQGDDPYWSANAINNSGQVVGYLNGEPFVYSGGVMTSLGNLPGYTISSANGINDAGDIAGSSWDATGHEVPFLYSDGVMTSLGILPGGFWAAASAINDKGQVVGATSGLNFSEAFLYSDGALVGLGFLPGDTDSGANAINNEGQIVGSSSFKAFLYSGGQMYDLNSLAALAPGSLSGAMGINDADQIIAGGASGYLLTPLQGGFVPITPCRIADTRTSPGSFGGPSLAAGIVRSFVIPQSGCGIPATAVAYSLNVTVVPQGPLDYLTVWPAGLPQPAVSTLNAFDGKVVANAAIVAAGQGGAVSVYAPNSTDVVLDINGYFDSTTGNSFYPVQPCRVADTRLTNNPLSMGEIRNIPMSASPCGLSSTAAAYSTNITVVPDGPLGYLTAWAAGQAQPYVSTLNSDGEIVANAAIVPAGTNAAVSVYVTNPTDLIVDTNGYFAAPGQPGALSFYPMVPCRVADTRDEDDLLGGPILDAGSMRTFPIRQTDCGIPATAAAYSLNVTAVPEGPLGYLSLWPAGQQEPTVSTLNSPEGSVVASSAIVAAGASGAINVYVTDQTHVILDINGYFAP